VRLFTYAHRCIDENVLHGRKGSKRILVFSRFSRRAGLSIELESRKSMPAVKRYSAENSGVS
jgi:hypothetical protein